jgi:hypothetical protein
MKWTPRLRQRNRGTVAVTQSRIGLVTTKSLAREPELTGGPESPRLSRRAGEAQRFTRSTNHQVEGSSLCERSEVPVSGDERDPGVNTALSNQRVSKPCFSLLR